MVNLRNLAITILRLAGAINIAAALRHHNRRPQPTTPGDHALLNQEADFAGALSYLLLHQLAPAVTSGAKTAMLDIS